VFWDFFTCRLRFPWDPILPSILERFYVKILKRPGFPRTEPRILAPRW
jgi:hypothetical protein